MDIIDRDVKVTVDRNEEDRYTAVEVVFRFAFADDCMRGGSRERLSEFIQCLRFDWDDMIRRWRSEAE